MGNHITLFCVDVFIYPCTNLNDELVDICLQRTMESLEKELLKSKKSTTANKTAVNGRKFSFDIRPCIFQYAFANSAWMITMNEQAAFKFTFC